ncbi:MAG: hypothetical protein OEO79_09565 [Gemmatimonadota bacterium]|nr:hypothetical protein [Gemmatimonadota bacterium]MDH3422022.1 hypothetical protein [Gemmatimonadota bacterium]
MKLRALFTLLLATAAINAAPVSAQNLSGTWQITSEGRRGSVTQTVTLRQEGSTVTGTISFTGGGPRGGGGGAPQAIEISNGTVEGAAFRFTMAVDFGGRGSFEQVFSGTYEGDFMEGTIEGGRGGAQPFMGTRGD